MFPARDTALLRYWQCAVKAQAILLNYRCSHVVSYCATWECQDICIVSWKKQKLSACRHGALKDYREDERQDKNGIKLPCCWWCLRNNNKKISMVLKERINQHDGKMAEPHCSHFLVLFTLRLSLLVSSTYVLQRQMKGREGERDRETSVGSYCV